jgi:fibronectin-binding autotransporter adhesin
MVNHQEAAMRKSGPMQVGVRFAALAFTGWIAVGGAAFAAGECGPTAAAVTCTSDDNPYFGGITYNIATGSIELTIASDVEVDREHADGKPGVVVSGGNTGTLSVVLEEGVKINTQGHYSDGVRVAVYDGGQGGVAVTSAADILVTIPYGAYDPADLYGTNGILGWIQDVDNTEDVTITQLAGTITVTGLNDTEWSGSGIYGLHDGLGSVTLRAAGTITTDGYEGYGLNATVDNADSHGAASTTLDETGSIRTTGEYATALYSLNNGLGNATATMHGQVETTGYAADGAFADVNNDDSEAHARVFLSNTAIVNTHGDEAKGAWVWNHGTGEATVWSEGQVTTTGEESYGLHARATNTLNAAAMSIDLAGDGSIVTTGTSAYGIFADHRGSGAVTVGVGAGTSVSATGNESVGVKAWAATGTATVDVGAGATIEGGWGDWAGAFTSAGVQIGSGKAGLLTNLGTIGALSDRAVAGDGNAGDLTIENASWITGFVDLIGSGTNTFNNQAGGHFVIRDFADTDGNGVRDTKRVAISDFGSAPAGTFNNAAGATVELGTVSGEKYVDPSGFYLPTVGIDNRALEADFYDLTRAGVVQGQIVNLGTFNNAGTIDLRGPAIGNTLVITGDAVAGSDDPGTGLFVSNGGTLLLNTVFNAGVAPGGGGTGSYSDVLVVDGTALDGGATKIAIDRREGAGALTPGNGILLVEVRNKDLSADDVFALNGDFLTNGQQAIVGGAFSYALYHNGVGDDDGDGNWYLRQIGQSPSDPIYEDYPKTLYPLNELPTLEQRVGNRYWSNPAPVRAPQTVFCKDPAHNFRCAVTDEQAAYYLDNEAPETIDGSGLWTRIVAARAHTASAHSDSGAVSDADIGKLQSGLDALLLKNADGVLVGSLTAQFGHVGAEITAPGAAGSINATGYGLGGTLTWYGTSGFYADGQAQANWFDSTLHSTTLNTTLADNNRGFGYAVSLEAGQRIALDSHWTLTPQAQLIYSNLNFDRFTDPFGTVVSLVRGDSLLGRLGLATEYQNSWRQEDGGTSRLSAYGLANLYREFLDGTQVDVSGTPFASHDDALWGGLSLGSSYEWDDGKYALHGELTGKTGLENPGQSYEASATLGLRVKW